MSKSWNIAEKRLHIAENKALSYSIKKSNEDISEMMGQIMDEYNSEEAKAERQRKYEELLRIGKLRKQAFDSGKRMDLYPVPWATREALEKQLAELEGSKSFFQDLDPYGWEHTYQEAKENLEKQLKERIELDKEREAYEHFR